MACQSLNAPLCNMTKPLRRISAKNVRRSLEEKNEKYRIHILKIKLGNFSLKLRDETGRQPAKNDGLGNIGTPLFGIFFMQNVHFNLKRLMLLWTQLRGAVAIRIPATCKNGSP